MLHVGTLWSFTAAAAADVQQVSRMTRTARLSRHMGRLCWLFTYIFVLGIVGGAQQTVVQPSGGAPKAHATQHQAGGSDVVVAATATALAANGANCAANQFNKGVDASGAAESCAALVDADVPNTITVDLATTATTANAGDSATAFFSTGTVENTYLPAASTTASGISELAIASEVNTGTSVTLAITPDALAGSLLGQAEINIEFFAPTTAWTTGDGKVYFHIATGSKLVGMNLIAATVSVIGAVSSSGLPQVDIARCLAVATGAPCSSTVADVLSTNLTIDANEDSSATAATAAVIDGTVDDVIADQMWRIDVDAIGTGTQGGQITLIFQLP